MHFSASLDTGSVICHSALSVVQGCEWCHAGKTAAHTEWPVYNDVFNHAPPWL